MPTGERVRVYLGLLSTLALQKAQGAPVDSLERRIDVTWRSLSDADKAHVRFLLRVPSDPTIPVPIPPGAALRLVQGETSKKPE